MVKSRFGAAHARRRLHGVAQVSDTETRDGCRIAEDDPGVREVVEQPPLRSRRARLSWTTAWARRWGTFCALRDERDGCSRIVRLWDFLVRGVARTCGESLRDHLIAWA
jgi:hypothetical protein